MTLLASRIGFAASHAASPVAAMDEIMEQLGEAPLAGLMLFCSHRFDRDPLARAINRRSEGVSVIGCTSSGELTDRGYDEDSLSAIAFPTDSFHLASHCFQDVDMFDPVAARDVVRSLVATATRDSQPARRTSTTMPMIDPAKDDTIAAKSAAPARPSRAIG